jgi:hypothetical protein
MARRSRKQARVLDDPNKVIVETSRGAQLECHPIITEIEAQEENIREQFEWPDVPQRDISDTVPPDADEKWPRTTDLTQGYIDTDFSTDEEKETWAEYRTKFDAVDNEYTAKLTDSRLRLIALRGVTILNQKPEAEWVKEHEWLGMVVPDEPFERLMHYFRTEVLGTTLDMFTITKGIYRAAGMDAEVLDQYEQSFRDQVGRAGREALGLDQERSEPEESKEEEGVVG